MAACFLRDHPGLRPFLLENVQISGTTIGVGSYGSVEEVVIPGAVCAAKRMHNFLQDPTQMPEAVIQKAFREFVQECQLMSTLRHPHIVQFLGVSFLPGSRLPALVMERLLTSLHEILDPEPPPETKPYIPVALKCSVLHDVAQGLSFLQNHSPPIIHRDLSARNVLLNSGMLAKIADLGVARIVPSLRAVTMTKAPGASIYMPPGALEDVSRYNVTIDIFSLGVLAIFTLSQTFPKPLSAAYMDDSGMMVGRTELERRGNYMQQIHRLLREGHPLIQMIQHCLKNRIRERPTIHAVLAFLEQARAEVQEDECDMSKLELVQTLRQKTQLIGRREGETRSLSQQLAGKDLVIQSKDDEIQTLSQQLAGKELVVLIKDDVVRSKDDEIQTLSQQKDQIVRSKDDEIRTLSQQKDQIVQSKDDEIRTLSQQKDQVIRSKVDEIRALSQQKDQIIRSKDDEIRTLSQQKDQVIQSKVDEIRMLSQQKDQIIRSKDDEIRKLSQQKDQIIRSKKDEIQTLSQQKDQVIQSKEEEIQQLQSSLDSRLQQLQSLQAQLKRPVEMQSQKWPLPLQWRRGKDLPEGIDQNYTVLLNGMVYVGDVGDGAASAACQVMEHNTVSGEWSKLPKAPVRCFAMTSFNGQLVLVGNHRKGDNDRITVWDSGRGEWAYPYPPMPTGRSLSAAVGYQNYLVVACGWENMDLVEVLDSSHGIWYNSQPLPVRGYAMSSVVVGDRWYLSSFRWKDYQSHVFCAHLPTLISSATSTAHANAASIWQELPTPPVDSPTLLALQGHLLLVGGRGWVQELHRYDPEARQWRECGQLPIGMYGTSCVVLPSGELMVAGGRVWVSRYSKNMWLGKYY